MPEIQEKVKILKGKELPINFVLIYYQNKRNVGFSFATLKEDIDVNKEF